MSKKWHVIKTAATRYSTSDTRWTFFRICTKIGPYILFSPYWYIPYYKTCIFRASLSEFQLKHETDTETNLTVKSEKAIISLKLNLFLTGQPRHQPNGNSYSKFPIKDKQTFNTYKNLHPVPLQEVYMHRICFF